jgi:TPR repeat protein
VQIRALVSACQKKFQNFKTFLRPAPSLKLPAENCEVVPGIRSTLHEAWQASHGLAPDRVVAAVPLGSYLSTRRTTMHALARGSVFTFGLLLLLFAGSVSTLRCASASQSQQNQSAPPESSFSALKSHADAGDAAAQYGLAVEYLRGNPAAPDYRSAMKWLNASAAQGNVDAEFMLGYLYEHGEGIETDYAKAAENYQAAAAKGHSAAANNLASLYQSGKGVRQNSRSALQLFQAAAQAGDGVAQGNLGLMYYHGYGTSRDYALAAKWFRSAAEHGDARAEHNLAFLYFKGWGVSIDYKESARWDRLAAEQGVPYAQTDLAYLYESGRGVPLDYVAAYTWYSRAIAGGDKTGIARRKSLRRIMTRRQLDQANAVLTAESSKPERRSTPVTAAFALFENH